MQIRDVFLAAAVMGFVLSLGSIAVFIVMNIALGNNPSIEAIYWQRIFVSKIMYLLTIPGIWLLFIFGSVSAFYNYRETKNFWYLFVILFLLLIVLNGTFVIVPLAEKVTAWAIEQRQSGIVNPDFLPAKTKEDSFGAVNFVLLIASFLISVFKRN